ncbi:acyl-homoserine-lactone synthase [Flavisphingomonas formosensis]|uniref:acyl-homoserine-lactone synthase n=1 Tax=Flavisphingomonas formosensis TaxID=861534 RepID=UPI0012F8E350|nr:acyl-homoserine-lactone synthase [Sphingomonas formosensis]
MIEIFYGATPPAADLIFAGMHRDRKRVFVDLLKWDVPVVDGRYEIDQFDTAQAIYLVALGADRTDLGSIRLLPTTGAHILGSLFPWLCDGPVPVSPQICEISRGCLSPRLRAHERLEIRNALTTAAVEFALLNDLASFTCIAGSGWLSQILSLGWDCMPLGLPQMVGRALTGALRVDITATTLRQLQRAGTYRSYPLSLGQSAVRELA